MLNLLVLCGGLCEVETVDLTISFEGLSFFLAKPASLWQKVVLLRTRIRGVEVVNMLYSNLR